MKNSTIQIFSDPFSLVGIIIYVQDFRPIILGGPNLNVAKIYHLEE
jgi:hypothetical protein